MASRITVRMSTGLAGAEWFAQNSNRLPDDVRQRIQDQLWLRAVLFQQRKRVDLAERDTYDRRADSILAVLDPAEQEAA